MGDYCYKCKNEIKGTVPLALTYCKVCIKTPAIDEFSYNRLVAEVEKLKQENEKLKEENKMLFNDLESMHKCLP